MLATRFAGRGPVEVIHPRHAGLHVHKETEVACVRLALGKDVSCEIKTFETTTSPITLSVAPCVTVIKEPRYGQHTKDRDRDRRFARHRFRRRKGFSRPGLQCCCNFAQCHQVEGTAVVSEAGLGGWRYWGRHYCRKSGGNSHPHIRLD